MIGPLKNLFGSKKDDFFLEISPSAPSPAPEPAAIVAPEPTPQPAPTPAKPAAKAKKAPAAAKPSKPAPQPAAPVEPPSPKFEAQTSFAPDNLLPLPQPRRRPGPSLNSYLGIVREMRRPR